MILQPGTSHFARPWRLTAAAIALTAIAACGGQPAADTDTVKVGFVASLTGVYKAVGIDMRDGFNLYVNTHGGKLGGRKADVVIGDEGDGPDTALPVATQMIKQQHVTALAGIVGGGSAAAIAKLSTDSKIPFIGANARPDLKDVSWVWTTSYLSQEPGAAIAPYIKSKVGDGTVYAIGPNYQGGYDEVGGFTTAYTKIGGKLANPGGKTIWTPFPQKVDYQPYLSQIKASGASAVYTFYAGDSATAFVTAYRQSDARDIPLYAAGFLTEGSVLAQEGDAALGITTVLNYAPDLTNPANDTFIAAWRAAGHTDLPSTYAMASYDAAAVLDQAIATIHGQVTPAAVNTAIGQLGQIDSPRGPWSFSKVHSPVQKWYLRQVVKDPTVLVNKQVQELATLGNS